MKANIEETIMQEFDELPAYHPDAISLARAYPDTYRRWGEQVNEGVRTWRARTETP